MITDNNEIRRVVVKTTLRLLILATAIFGDLRINSFIFIEMGVSLFFLNFGGDSLAKASHDSRQQLDSYAFIFSICYMFVFSYICNVLFLCYYHTNPLQLSAKFTFKPATEV